MSDQFLVGNGMACPGCGLRVAALIRAKPFAARDPLACNYCPGGCGRLAIPPGQIVAAQLAENENLKNEG